MSLAEGGDSPRGVGRPSLYRPEYCQQVKDFMARGHSLTAFAGEIDVTRETLYNWAENHPDFLYAKGVAKCKRVKALEVDLLDKEATSQIVTSRIFALKGAAWDEYGDKAPPATNVTVNLNQDGGGSYAELGRRVAFALAAAMADGAQRNADLPSHQSHILSKPNGNGA